MRWSSRLSALSGSIARLCERVSLTSEQSSTHLQAFPFARRGQT
jgi:hypothetical protein